MLNITKRCNLNCKYCFENKQYRTKEMMSLEVAKERITEYMNKEDEFDEVIIDFFGGEPFLAFDLIRQIVDWVKSEKWKKEYFFSIGTNGTILTEEMKEWLIKNRHLFSVGVSLDGSKEAHNISRDNSYDIIKKNLPFFQKNWPAQPAKMTICAETIPYVAKSIMEMEESVLSFTANVVMEDIWGSLEEKKRLLDIYAEQLSQLVSFYADHPQLYPVTILDRKIENIRLKNDNDNSENTKKVKRFCGSGHEMRMVDIDGNIYPCHRFSPWITKKPSPQEIQNHQTQWKPSECKICKLLPLCPTCSGYNYELNGESGIRSTYHCEALKLEVLATAQLQAIKLEKDPPDFDNLSQKEGAIIKRRIEGILEIDEFGI